MSGEVVATGTLRRLLDAAQRLGAAAEAHREAERALVERVAEALYETERAYAPQSSSGAPGPWVRNGNSIKQDECRDRARAALGLIDSRPARDGAR